MNAANPGTPPGAIPFTRRLRLLQTAVALCGVALLPSSAAAQIPLAQRTVPLTTVVNIRNGNSDWTSVSDPARVLQNSLRRQTFYLPAGGAGTVPLYRLFDSRRGDHMDSLIPGESGYQTEFVLGNVWTARVEQGLSEVHRYFNPTTLDHLTTFPGDGLPPAGYRDEGIRGYAFARYPNLGEKLLWLHGSRVAIGANLVAGGAISELWLDNSMQFVNAWDYGRELQNAFGYSLQGVSGQNQVVDNPTEAGSQFGWPMRQDYGHGPQDQDPALAQGSPLVAAAVRNNILQTSTYPLQWNPQQPNFGLTGGPMNPLMSRTLLSKEVDVDFLGRPNLVRWSVTLNGLQGSGAAGELFAIEMPTAYLTSDFQRFILYYPGPSLTDERTGRGALANPYGGGQEFTGLGSGFAGMLATADGRYALGFYVPRALVGLGRFDADSGIAFYNFLGAPAFGGGEAAKKYDSATAKMSLILRSRAGIAGSQSWTTYLMVGSISDVKQEASWLYARGY
jgi:hypothetical protein